MRLASGPGGAADSRQGPDSPRAPAAGSAASRAAAAAAKLGKALADPTVVARMADLGDQHPRRGVAQPWHHRQPRHRGAKRDHRRVEVALQFGDGGLERFDLRQMQLQHEAVMGGHVPVEGVDEFGPRRLEPARGETVEQEGRGPTAPWRTMIVPGHRWCRVSRWTRFVEVHGHRATSADRDLQRRQHRSQPRRLAHRLRLAHDSDARPVGARERAAVSGEVAASTGAQDPRALRSVWLVVLERARPLRASRLLTSSPDDGIVVVWTGR